MNKVSNIEEALDHILQELICINCKHRFLDLCPSNLWLKQLECPNCKETGYLIDTGEVVPNDTYERICNEHPELKIYRQYSWVYQKEE